MAVANPTPPIGKSLARVDGRFKVTGAATYAAEFQRSQLTYGVLIQSSIANGRVVKIDISAAKSAPGVIEILTRENTPGFKPYPDDLTKKGAPGENRMPLQDDEIHYAGQHLGGGLAETFEQATDAVSLVRGTYQAQAPIVDRPLTRTVKTATTPDNMLGL